ncbi:MAG: hypothetical protein K2Y28_04520, partial [Burkholderiaceae bacterium]|nr:hypothetical protein [Burkholderiaceae bacterium]
STKKKAPKKISVILPVGKNVANKKTKDTEQALYDAQLRLRKLKEQGHISQADFNVLIKGTKG